MAESGHNCGDHSTTVEIVLLAEAHSCYVLQSFVYVYPPANTSICCYAKAETGFTRGVLPGIVLVHCHSLCAISSQNYNWQVTHVGRRPAAYSQLVWAHSFPTGHEVFLMCMWFAPDLLFVICHFVWRNKMFPGIHFNIHSSWLIISLLDLVLEE